MRAFHFLLPALLHAELLTFPEEVRCINTEMTLRIVEKNMTVANATFNTRLYEHNGRATVPGVVSLFLRNSCQKLKLMENEACHVCTCNVRLRWRVLQLQWCHVSS